MNTVKCHEYMKYSLKCQKLIISAIMSIHHLDPRSTNEVARPRLPSSVLFAFGGWSGASPTNAMECYDSRAGAWVNVTVTGEIPRAYHGTAFYRGYVFIVGGFDGLEFFKSVRRFDPVGVIWQEAECDSVHLTYGLMSMCTQVGGFDGVNRQGTVEVYLEDVNSWSLVPSMLNPRSNFGLEVVDDVIVVAGGFNGYGTIRNVEGYDYKSRRWNNLMEMAVNRSALSCCVADDLPNVDVYAAPRDVR
uniref:Kelch-like protein 10 n=1 Tax=Eptatretus burgeri TaxID=7764 RepID=A0A8C4QAD2_EPTBU